MSAFIDTLYQIIGTRIKSRREELNLNQGTLAKSINIGRTSISNIEIGRHKPPLHILYSISNALHLDIQMLLPTFKEVEEEVLKSDKNESNKHKQIIRSNNDLDEKAKREIETFIKNLGDDN